jgi:hypothetical protein
VVSWYVKARNSFVAMEEQIDGAWAEVDNQLQGGATSYPTS